MILIGKKVMKTMKMMSEEKKKEGNEEKKRKEGEKDVKMNAR